MADDGLPPCRLDPAVEARLDPVYLEYYNTHLAHRKPVWHCTVTEARNQEGPPQTHSQPLPVGKILEFSIPRRESPGPEVHTVCLVPPGDAPPNGWPVAVYYHGGGWVFGQADTEMTICSNMCVRSRAVVISTNYRLAPEDPFPAAIDDAWEAYLWTVSEAQRPLNLDLSKVAIVGTSAGGNIAAVTAQKAASRPQPGVSLVLQVLVVPITDNTATPESSPSWKEFEFTAQLPAAKMLWYRSYYLPNLSDWSSWSASPLLASDDVFRTLPPAYIVVGELDILKHDGEEYARRLSANGVPAKVNVVARMPHPFPAMDAILEAGRTVITNVCDELRAAFV
ncbi:hypothetical protein G647_08478 [Cladophialophora carrionii CBS 160.54]|uniref:Alpha/beta hydrolase fold-3 domain-containing protein n=1 Tax=Cladophialophora carrionii CBS 160.54 TaxID=1279043 RepID=V9D2E3_9EURO|nr:uncharacterized protein G647_08478 [Cladophialophora carrionii CBS 160.54]ETI20443.1 hypothetical protein G647_08478 [Cladophialophora carrionii CBS 160.54]